MPSAQLRRLEYKTLNGKALPAHATHTCVVWGMREQAPEPPDSLHNGFKTFAEAVCATRHCRVTFNYTSWSVR